MAKNDLSHACKIIDKTLITVCKKNATGRNIVTIIKGLIKAGVEVFEIDGDTRSYLERLIKNSSHKSELKNKLTSMSFAYRLSSVERESNRDRVEKENAFQDSLFHANTMYLIVSIEDFKSPTSFVKNYIRDANKNKGKKLILEMSVDVMYELFNKTLWTQIKKITLEHEINILRITGLSSTILPMDERYIDHISNELHVEVDICALNTCFTATAIALESIQHGANYVTTHFNGGSGRYAPVEEVVIANALLLDNNKSNGDDFSFLQKVATIYEAIVDNKISPNKPVIGENIFHYESGVHADGIAKNHATYEPYAPELVGKERKLIIGKHSSRKSLLTKIEEWKLPVVYTQVPAILEKIKHRCIQLKRNISDEDIMTMIKSINEQTIQAKELS